jgi:trans-aconitate 2-methyltransferase
LTRDWDAAVYDRVSGIQEAWARNVLARLPLEGDEVVLDAGCGSGRVTRLLLERFPRGRVMAVDSSESMTAAALQALDERATVLTADLTELSLPEPVDAAFSNAVFHWIPDHDRLFESLGAEMRPGAPRPVLARADTRHTGRARGIRPDCVPRATRGSAPAGAAR